MNKVRAMVWLAGAGMLAAQAVLLAFTIRAAEQAKGRKVVRAERFDVVDSRGRLRGRFSAAGDSVSLSVRDARGKVCAVLALGAGGVPSLSFWFPEGPLCARLGLVPGGPALSLFDADGRESALLHVSPWWGSTLRLLHANGKEGARVSVYPNAAVLSLSYARGEPSISVSARQPTFRTGLEAYDTHGKMRTHVGLDSFDAGVVELSDRDENPRAVPGHTSLERTRTGATEERPESSLVLFDKEGKVLWTAP
jgi:hypothetical protein